MLSHAVTTAPAAEPGTGAPSVRLAEEGDPQAGPVAAGEIYRRWAWPVSLRCG
jgi:hypothetical protein